ncbi:Glycosyltransferase family 29 (sialyltransferase) [Aquimixticola soesokkakensis]|uniref:Glycosyltransferase family 29 (Sialyltransferase) n=1 Tax=Aquimixticola soesokkakensis TaxID=1519096 RepID=A0A1Y5RG51_9RHOB|nr:glycosyltransferase family 29 protein [Aquimixticola soesokkakensis]SLN15474.1 Glycosyltransferase family 29 (sialyltransferase) [Aquimixticola soesokkakensis]
MPSDGTVLQRLRTQLRFRWAALRNEDDVLGRGGVPLDVLAQQLAGKRVALVGNARALEHRDFGAQINAADVVIRINRAPRPSVRSHGARTDWLALATSLSGAAFDDIGAAHLIWMSHKRKRLRLWMARPARFTLFPADRYQALKSTMGAQPTTGAMLVAWLSDTDLAQLDLWGFDFFASLSLSGGRDAGRVPHDFSAEAKFVTGVCARDPRVIHHPME